LLALMTGMRSRRASIAALLGTGTNMGNLLRFVFLVSSEFSICPVPGTICAYYYPTTNMLTKHVISRPNVAAALFLCAAVTAAHGAPEPALSLTAGLSAHTPHNAPGVRSGGGFRGGFALPASLPAGNLRIPLEWGFALRTASLRFSDTFDRLTFTDLQVPFLMHGDLFGWKFIEPIALWTPSYTVDAVSEDAEGGQIAYTDGLRTRFNMAFGAGLQGVYRGFRLRAYGAYNIFPPVTGSKMTTTDWVIEAAVPLFWKRGTR
jgi:hypothetical protein